MQQIVIFTTQLHSKNNSVYKVNVCTNDQRTSKNFVFITALK